MRHTHTHTLVESRLCRSSDCPSGCADPRCKPAASMAVDAPGSGCTSGDVIFRVVWSHQQAHELPCTCCSVDHRPPHLLPRSCVGDLHPHVLPCGSPGPPSNPLAPAAVLATLLPSLLLLSSGCNHLLPLDTCPDASLIGATSMRKGP